MAHSKTWDEKTVVVLAKHISSAGLPLLRCQDMDSDKLIDLPASVAQWQATKLGEEIKIVKNPIL